MNPDDVIDYLRKLENNAYPYLETYYEYLINNNNAPDSYYTSLAQLYVDRLFVLQPKSFSGTTSRDELKVREYRQKLQKFLETKKQYE